MISVVAMTRCRSFMCTSYEILSWPVAISPSGVLGLSFGPVPWPGVSAGLASPWSMLRRLNVMPTATAITAAIINRTIGLKRMLPDESPPPPEPPDPTAPSGVTWSFSLSFFLPVSSAPDFDPFAAEDVGAPPVGSGVADPPDDDDPPDDPPDECAPDCGILGRYSSPAGAATAGA